MAGITHVNQLPSWFSLEKYDVCNSFTPEDWANELSVRKVEWYMVAIARGSVISRPDSPLLDPSYVSSRIDFANPIRYASCEEEITSLYGDSELLSETGANVDPRGIVRPIRWGELESPELPLGILQEFSIPLNAGQLTHDEVYPFGWAHLAIDLSAPDSALKQKFAEVLKKYRKHFGVPNPAKSGTDSSVAKLRGYKVLAYLDLQNWSTLTGKDIPAEVCATALCFEAHQGGKFVRETLKDWAFEALSPGFISTLRRTVTG